MRLKLMLGLAGFKAVTRDVITISFRENKIFLMDFSFLDRGLDEEFNNAISKLQKAVARRRKRKDLREIVTFFSKQRGKYNGQLRLRREGD